MDEIYDMLLYSKDLCNYYKKYYNYTLEEYKLLMDNRCDRVEKILNRKCSIQNEINKIEINYEKTRYKIEKSNENYRDDLLYIKILEGRKKLNKLKERIEDMELSCKFLMERRFCTLNLDRKTSNLNSIFIKNLTTNIMNL